MFFLPAEIFAVLAFFIMPAILAYRGWKSGKTIDRGECFLAAIGSGVLFALGTAVIQSDHIGPSGSVAVITGMALWTASAAFWSYSAGKRMKDAGMPQWATFLLGALFFLILPSLLVILMPSKACEELPQPATSDSSETPMKPERIEHPEYRLQVPDGEDRGEGYVAISHGQTYALILHNFSSRNCDVRVEIDGQHVGTWRVPKSDSQRIERPAHDTGRFTFLAAGTSEARSAGIQEGNDKNGLISATFMPEKIQRSGYLSAARLSDAKEGATGLSGESKQRFTNTDALDTDESAYFTIHLRLVAKNPVVRPLMGSSTPIPPPLPP